MPGIRNLSLHNFLKVISSYITIIVKVQNWRGKKKKCIVALAYNKNYETVKNKNIHKSKNTGEKKK